MFRRGILIQHFTQVIFLLNKISLVPLTLIKVKFDQNNKKFKKVQQDTMNIFFLYFVIFNKFT